METLELPNGETVTPDDVFLYEGYPYRFRPADEETTAFYLTPLYWGGGEMDIPFSDRGVLRAQWGEESRGLLSEEAWADWLSEARTDERFDDEELDAVARELGLAGEELGLLARLRRTLGL
jgi:hypothetical protein